MGTCRLDSRDREISRNQAWKQKLNKSVSFNYYFFDCTLNDTLTAKYGDQFRRQQLKWAHPWFVPETTSILSTFLYRSSPGFWTSAVKGRFTVGCTVSSWLFFEFWPRYWISYRRNALHWINSLTNVFINRSWQKLAVIIEELVPDSARSWCRFKHIAEKQKKTLKVTKLTSCMNFRMIQAD